MTTFIDSVFVGATPRWTVADRLRKAREDAGLDQVGLSARSGLSRTTISAAENGRRVPSRASMTVWAMATGVSPSWLATGETSEDVTTLRLTALRAVIGAAHSGDAVGHESAASVLEAVGRHENDVHQAGQWQASSAIAQPEVAAWCRQFRPELGRALDLAENASDSRA